MRKIVTTGLALILFVLVAATIASSEAAQQTSPAQARIDIGTIVSNLKRVSLEQINKNLPARVSEMFGTNTIQLYVDTSSGPEHFWVKTKEGVVEQVGRGRILFPKPTLKIEFSEETMQNILTSQDRLGVLQQAIKEGKVKVSDPRAVSKQGLAIKAGIAGSKLGLLPSQTQPATIKIPDIFDISGKRTTCNQKWELLKDPIGCNGPFQEFGYGKNCCEKECGADAECDEEAPGSVKEGTCNVQCRFSSSPLPAPPVKLIPPKIKVTDSSGVGEYPGYKVCDFYQRTKKLVSCGVIGFPERFCQMVMTSPGAVPLKCEENGLVICGLPCSGKGTFYTVDPTVCAFDINRDRGANAPPLDFCG